MFLLKSDHQHEIQCHPRNSQPPTPPPPEKKTKTQQKPRLRVNVSPTPQSFNAADALAPELSDSLEFIPHFVFDFMTFRRKEIQRNVYTSVVEDQHDFLSRLFQGEEVEKVNFWIRDGIRDISHQVLQHVCNDIIKDDQYEVKRKKKVTKQELMNGRTPESIIKIREQMLKAKISQLRVDLNVSSSEKNNSSVVFQPGMHHLFSPNSKKTKVAEEFVTKMQKMQEQSRKEKQRREQIKRQKKHRAQEQRRQMEERLKQQKHEFLKKQYQEKRQQKQKYFQDQEQKKQQFKEYLKEHNKKKPLFKKRQQQFFKNFIMKENNKKMEILQQIRDQHQPISHEQLTQHEKQYLQIREDNEYEKNAGRMMQLKSRKRIPKYFKSRHHSLVEKQFLAEPQNPLEKKTQMYNKRWEYSTEIKTKFAPKVSIEKKRQLRQILESEKWVEKNKNKVSEDGAKIDGMNNLDQVHRLVAQLRAKGKLRDGETSRTISHTPPPPRPKYINYLHELNNSKEGIRHSLNLSHIERKEPEYVTMEARRIEQNALRREQYLNNLTGVNIEQYLTEKKKLDEDYIESAKAKMNLINKYE